MRLVCDNATVVQDKKSIKGDTIQLLETIHLIAAVFDIEILAFWIYSEENIVADATYHHDYEKSFDLGFQVSSLRNRKLSPASKMSTLPAAVYILNNTLAPATRTNSDSQRQHLSSINRRRNQRRIRWN